MTQTITLTDDQAAAFQRGESITLEPTTPPKLLTYIVVGSQGAVYEAKTHDIFPARFVAFDLDGRVTRLRVGANGGGYIGQITRGLSRFDARPWNGHFDAIKVQG